MAMTGTVRFFNGVRGYGFIKPDDGGSDVFVHISAVERAGLNYLTAGQRITFDVEPEKEGQRPQGGETGDRILKWRATPIPRLEPPPYPPPMIVAVLPVSSNRACRRRWPSHRPARSGFTRSSTTAIG
jgi:CspA family cold shock protein